MDELLFLLLQKKFRDLGEFVEGKEKMNIVINRSYRDEKQAIKAICMPESLKGDSDIDEEVDLIDKSVEDTLKNLANEDALRHDIEELAFEEQATMKIDSDDEEGFSERIASLKNLSNNAPQNEAGSSQQHAICLSDDEDDDVPNLPDSIKDVYTQYSESRNINVTIPPRPTTLTVVK